MKHYLTFIRDLSEVVSSFLMENHLPLWKMCFWREKHKCNGLHAKPIIMHIYAVLIPYIFTQRHVHTWCGAVKGMNPFSGKMQLFAVSMALVYAEQGREMSQLMALVQTWVLDSQCDDLRLDSGKFTRLPTLFWLHLNWNPMTWKNWSPSQTQRERILSGPAVFSETEQNFSSSVGSLELGSSWFEALLNKSFSPNNWYNVRGDGCVVPDCICQLRTLSQFTNLHSCPHLGPQALGSN